MIFDAIERDCKMQHEKHYQQGAMKWLMIDGLEPAIVLFYP